MYNENVNGEDFSENDLIYVPRNLQESYLVDRIGEDDDGNDIVLATAEEQWAALDAFIAEDDYLSERRGDYAETERQPHSLLKVSSTCAFYRISSWTWVGRRIRYSFP